MRSNARVSDRETAGRRLAGDIATGRTLGLVVEQRVIASGDAEETARLREELCRGGRTLCRDGRRTGIACAFPHVATVLVTDAGAVLLADVVLDEPP